MHVCSVFVLDPSTIPGGEFGRFRDAIDVAVSDIPQFTQKVRKVPLEIAHPVGTTPFRHQPSRSPRRAARRRRLRRADGAVRPGRLPAGQPPPSAVGMWAIEAGDVGRGQTGSATMSARQTRRSSRKMHHATVDDGCIRGSIISHMCVGADAQSVAAMMGEGHGKARDEQEPSDLEIFGRCGHPGASRGRSGLTRIVQPSIDVVVKTVERAVRKLRWPHCSLRRVMPFNNNITVGQRTIALNDMLPVGLQEIRRLSGDGGRHP